MDIKPVWTEERTVEPFQGDFQGRLHLAGFLQHMQVAASNHAEHLGFSFEALHEQNMAWVLSRVRINFERFPEIQDKLIIRTWPKTIERKIMFIRDFALLDENDVRYAAATTLWLMIDTRRWHLIPINKLNGTLPDNSHLHAIQEIPGKINFVEGMQEKYTVQARFSDIDIMGHVTNTRYADWVANCFEQSLFKDRQLKWMQINYTKEVRPGEVVSVTAGHDPLNEDVWLIKGSNQTTGNDAFEAAVGWYG